MEPEMRKTLTTAEQRYDYKIKELDDEKWWCSRLESQLREAQSEITSLKV